MPLKRSQTFQILKDCKEYLITPGKKTRLIVAGGICLIFVVLRFWNLTDSCLWFDEIFSIHAAENTWSELFSFIAQDLIHPPLFYMLLKLWMTAVGDGLFFVRLYPVIFSVAAFVPFYLLCRRLKLENSEIVLALVFFACSGALIKYSQEVRMYSQLLCLSLFSYWLFVRFLDLGKNIWILTIINVLLVYTHYFGWLVIISEITAILVFQRIKIRQILTMFGIAIVSFVPWILMIFRAAAVNADLAQNIGWIERPNPFVLIKTITNLLEPFYFQQSNTESFTNFFISLPLIFILILGMAFFIAGWHKTDENGKRNFLLLLIFIKIPAILVFAASWIFPFSFWGTRHLIIIFAPVFILLSFILHRIEVKPVKYAVFVALAVIFTAAFIMQIRKPPAEYVWCAWEKFAVQIEKDQPQKIYVFEDLIAYHFWFALRNDSNTEIVKVKNFSGMLEDTAYFLPRGFDKVRIADSEDFRDTKFFVAYRDSVFNDKHPPLNTLKEKGFKVGEPKIIHLQNLQAILVEVSK